MGTNQVSLGFTGVGGRGGSLLRTSLNLEHVTFDAVCDVQEQHLETVTERIVDDDRPEPAWFTDHETMVSEAELDAVIIATPWRMHLPMAMTAMEHGVDVGVEVGPASTVEECWELVRTAEETGSRCMLLENCCYGGRELAILQMVRAGVFGEVIHTKCGYGHDLRAGLVGGKQTRVKFGEARDFRGINHEKRNGDLYPTHGVGPLAQQLDINRGNRFVSLTSTASKARGLADWAEKNLPEDHPRQDVDWEHGDIITTTIKCANGETMTVTHDVSLVRPYSRMYHVQGTGGIWQADGDLIHIDGESPEHEWESFTEDYKPEWEHPLWQDYREAGVRGGHGGHDYLVLRDFVRGVADDGPLPIDVYDTAAWMAISPLSEQSIEQGNDSVAFPDFTNGEWMTREPSFDPQW